MQFSCLDEVQLGRHKLNAKQFSKNDIQLFSISVQSLVSKIVSVNLLLIEFWHDSLVSIFCPVFVVTIHYYDSTYSAQNTICQCGLRMGELKIIFSCAIDFTNLLLPSLNRNCQTGQLLLFLEAQPLAELWVINSWINP